MAEQEKAGRQPGWREVLIVAVGVVGLVLGLAVATSLLPTQVQEIVFHTPLLILVLVGGTAFVLWRILRSPGPGPGPGA